MLPLAATLRPAAGLRPAAPASPCGVAAGWRWPGGKGGSTWRGWTGTWERWRGGDRSAPAHPFPIATGHRHAGFNGV
jgi:hypothetical protein